MPARIELPQLDPKIRELIDQSPSIFRNSALAFVLWVVFSILGGLLSLTGIGLLVELRLRHDFLNEFFQELLELPSGVQADVDTVLWLFALGALSTGLLFSLIARLTRMLMKRNAHLLEFIIRRDEIDNLHKAHEKERALKGDEIT